MIELFTFKRDLYFEIIGRYIKMKYFSTSSLEIYCVCAHVSIHEDTIIISVIVLLLRIHNIYYSVRALTTELKFANYFCD